MISGTFAGVDYPLPTHTPLASADQCAKIAGDMIQASANLQKVSPRLAGALVSPRLRGTYLGAETGEGFGASVSGMFESASAWVSKNAMLALGLGLGVVFLPVLLGGKRRR